ncbi:MAG: hypothetical protein IKK32_01750 [Oscillospiraceae bacterium]|nr:hypothetical protein [Oscillospiraceae bacterium]
MKIEIKEKIKRNLPKMFSFFLFFGVITILPIITIILPKKEFSEIENRVLSDAPKFSFSSVLDRSFMKDSESYFADHFVGRTEWIKAKTQMELLSGRREINGVYIDGERMVEKLDSPDYKTISKSISAINNFSETTGLKTYVMIVPTSAEIYSSSNPNINQKEEIDSIYSELSGENIITLDAYNALNSNKEDYIYYRTDHHWTTLGAYYVYSTTIYDMGFTPISWDNYNIEHASSEFKGTLYSKTLYDGIKSDMIDIYYPVSGVDITSVDVYTGKRTENYESYYFRDFLETKDKYSVFGGQNQPVVNIKTNSYNENKLLVIKDSYANSYVPFLSQHYSEITMLDMRYIDVPYNEIVDIDDYDQVLFLYNYSTFAQDKNIRKLDF